MAETILMVDEKGDLASLYTDLIPLRELGRLDVRRVSHVEFDNARQGWTVMFSRSIAGGAAYAKMFLCSCKRVCERRYTGHQTAVFLSREEAVAAEIEYLQAHL